MIGLYSTKPLKDLRWQTYRVPRHLSSGVETEIEFGALTNAYGADFLYIGKRKSQNN